MWLRILNAMKKRYQKKRLYALVIAATYFFIFLSLILINKIFYSKNNDALSQTQISITQDNCDFDFSLSCSDKKVFSDTVRSVKIISDKEPVYSSVTVTSLNGEAPVLFSENDFIKNQDNSISFSLPLYPPAKLDFSYGSKSFSQTITAEQIFYDEQTGMYYSKVKTLQTEGES